MKNKIVFCVVLVLIVMLDQVIKFNITLNKISFSTKLIDIIYAKNTGMAFSILDKNNVFIIILSIVLIGIICAYFIKNIYKLSLIQIISLAMLLGGALTNLIDRVFRGFVVDYIKINIFDFPIFNIADFFVVVSVIIIMINFIISSIENYVK